MLGFHGNKMYKVLILYLPLVFLLAVFTYGCGGGGGQGAGSDYTPPEVNPGEPFSLELSPNRQVGQTNAPIDMTALVRDQNGDPVANTTVKFLDTTGLASLSDSSRDVKSGTVEKRKNSVFQTTTNDYGQAKVRINSTSPGFVSIEAYTGGGIMVKRSVYFNPSGGSSFSPMWVDVDIDGNNNGEYNELDDFKVCQTSDDDEVDVRVTTYYKGDIISYVDVLVNTDVSNIVEFPNNIYAVYSASGSNGILMGCDYDGDGTMYECDYNSNGIVVQDLITVDNLGRGYTSFNIDCKLITQQRLINVTAVTRSYSFEEFNNAVVIGTGGSSLFLQPVEITGVKITADPDTISTGETSYIEVSVDTTLGPATAPDGTVVQLDVKCKDRADWSLTGGLSTLQTLGGKASTIFTAPTSIPIDDSCTIMATVADESASVQLTITQPLEVVPGSQTIDSSSTDLTATYTIRGGTKPYEISSDRPDLVLLSLSGSTITATVIKVPETSEVVTITVKDAKHAKVDVTLNVTAPDSAITLSAVGSTSLTNPQVGDTVQFVISGGMPPYTATPSSDIISASVSDNILTVTLTQVPNKTTSVAVTVEDTMGNTAVGTITITISTDPLTVTAIGTTIILNPQINDAVQFLVDGGVSPYTFATSSPLVSLNLVDNILTATVIELPTSDTTVAITVKDSTGEQAVVTLTLDVEGATDLTVTVVGSDVLGDPSIGDIVQFIISGGTKPYTAKSSSNLVTVEVDDNILTATVQGLPGSSVSVALTVTDAAGSTEIATLTITVSPENVTDLVVTPVGSSILIDPKIGDNLYYQIRNGVKPYSGRSSSSLVTVSVSDELLTATVAELPDRTTDLAIVVSDSKSSVSVALMSLNLTSDVAPNLSIIPEELVIYNDVTRTLQYTVSHGRPPYQIISNSPTVAFNGTAGNHTWEVTTDPGNFTVNIGTVGQNQAVTLTVIDNYGATAIATLNVLAGSP